MTTRIFLDSGSSQDTKHMLELLGQLDGQTTNPSLIAKSPGAQARIKQGDLFSEEEILAYYKQTIQDIRALLPTGALSIEVYADKNTTAPEMISQAKIFSEWTHDPYIKLPTTREGLNAARELVDLGMNVNMTLVFSEAQAAAVYVATLGAKKGQVFLSPFIGRLDDIGENGISLINNIATLYKQGDGHVEILAASIRSIDHLYASMIAGAESITAPTNILNEWAEAKNTIPEAFQYLADGLSDIQREGMSLDLNPDEYNIQHDLTDKGLQKFADDWNGLLKK